MASNILLSPVKIRAAIKSAIKNARPSKIAVPFWGEGAIKALDLSGSLTGRVQVLCNLPSGACNPTVIRKLMASGAEVRSLSTLHAKVFLGDAEAVVGSANASSDGLGLRENSGWNEACVRVKAVDDLAVLGRWFEELWERAADLSNPHIARLLLEQAEGFRERGGGNGELVDLVPELLRAPERFRDQRLFVTLDWIPYSQQVDNHAKDLGRQLGQDIDAWQDWPEMPANAQIISFYYDRTAPIKLTYEGTWQTPLDPAQATGVDRAIYVAAVPRILGCYRLGNLASWARAAAKFQKDLFAGRKPSHEQAILHISDFAVKYLGPSR